MSAVTVPAWKCLNDVEALLVEGGIPPLPLHNGLMKSWFDPKEDTMTFVYTPIQEARREA